MKNNRITVLILILEQNVNGIETDLFILAFFKALTQGSTDFLQIQEPPPKS